MKQKIKNSLRAFGGVVVLGLGAGVSAQNIDFSQNVDVAQSCLSDVQIQQAVTNSQILPLNIVMRNAGIDKSSKVLPPISVCDVDGVLFYKFSVLNKNGVVKKLVLPATAPIS